ncbi:MAG: MFS transporter [Saprospiraceae bacterium]|nr:MFS transporter [Saprospiraceae bacterium]
MDTALLLLILGWAFVLVWVPLTVLSQRKMHPKALFTLFFAEMWERFSFYGMRAFLVLYIAKEIFSSLGDSGSMERSVGIYGAFNALLYAAPIVGGMLADRLFGFRRAVILGAIMMAAGQFIMAFNAATSDTTFLLFTGLSVLAIGNGFFKPNISSFLGTFYEQNDRRKDSAFTIFYMGINVGAFLAPLTCGYLAEKFDYSLGFMTAGLGMLLGLIVFWRNMSKYEDKGNPPDPAALNKPVFGIPQQWLVLIGVLISIPLFGYLIDNEGVTNYILIIAGIGVIGYILISSLFFTEDKQEGQRLVVFLFLFFFHMIFWTLFEQAGGSLNFLTDKYVEKHGIETSMFQSLNALFIILLAPVFTWIWNSLSKKNMEPRTPIKFTWALLQMALGYFIIVAGARTVLGTVNDGALIPVMFLVFMYLFHTTGELSLSPVGLSVVTKLSPAKTVGFVMGTWFLSISFAHKIAGKLGQMIAAPGNDAAPAEALSAYVDVYMTWGVYITLGAAALLFVLSPWLKKWMHGVH